MLAMQKNLSNPFLAILALPATALGFALSVQISALSWILTTQYGLDVHDIGFVWAAGPLAGSTKTAQEFIDQVRSPRRNMPSFSAEQISDQMITDIHAYVGSLPEVTDFTRPDAGLPADAPQGQVLLVEKRCIACHGDTGPINGFIERGETPTAERVINQLRTPFKNMPSFSPEQVSDAEAALIAASARVPRRAPASL